MFCYDHIIRSEIDHYGTELNFFRLFLFACCRLRISHDLLDKRIGVELIRGNDFAVYDTSICKLLSDLSGVNIRRICDNLRVVGRNHTNISIVICNRNSPSLFNEIIDIRFCRINRKSNHRYTLGVISSSACQRQIKSLGNGNRIIAHHFIKVPDSK